ncbi:YggS family pyridoxal phosphate-dependent enzyme [Aliidiomarina sp. Khilg15.8]
MMAIADSVHTVMNSIKSACEHAGREPDSVRLLAVSKTKPVSDIEAAYEAGLREFGENYVQEGVEKVDALHHLDDCVWHFVGPLQSNKTRPVAERFDWVQSIDRLKIARRLSEQRPSELPPLQVLIQVNIDDEESKSGIELSQLRKLAADINELANIELRGIMAIPAANADEAQQAQSFQALAEAFQQLQSDYPQVDTLSLGMSSDLELAIAHGSTMVRVGTSLFGKRD